MASTKGITKLSYNLRIFIYKLELAYDKYTDRYDMTEVDPIFRAIQDAISNGEPSQHDKDVKEYTLRIINKNKLKEGNIAYKVLQTYDILEATSRELKK